MDELVLRRSELQRAKKDYSESHKEKDFAKIQEKKRDVRASQNSPRNAGFEQWKKARSTFSYFPVLLPREQRGVFKSVD